MVPDECGAGIVDAQAAVAGLGGSDPGNGEAPRGSYSTAGEVKRRAVRRRGFRVTCKAAAPGTCRVVVRRKGRKIARGSDDVPAAIDTVVSAELNRRGRRALKRMGERLRVRVFVTLPGEEAQSRRVTVAQVAERRFQAVSTSWRNPPAKYSTAG